MVNSNNQLVDGCSQHVGGHGKSVGWCGQLMHRFDQLMDRDQQGAEDSKSNTFRLFILNPEKGAVFILKRISYVQRNGVQCLLVSPGAPVHRTV